uniref:Uncharacterized protein n=1 Tax=Physcomitrium patens TaxID=3218 RepID=A0A2K1KEH2_PHYPA|nr:hypothetical protein PHYPA_008523 [Physcomitrium patens]
MIEWIVVLYFAFYFLVVPYVMLDKKIITFYDIFLLENFIFNTYTKKQHIKLRPI